MKAQQITDCLDLLAGFEHMEHTEQKHTFLLVIDTLGSYPKPMKKGDSDPVKPYDLGAYLLVSNVRNACKLVGLGLLKPTTAHAFICDNLESALTLLQG